MADTHTIQVGATDRTHVVPRESIRVIEQGPGGVSSMRFDLIDSAGTLAPTKYQPVLFMSNTVAIGSTVFRGYVVRARSRPAFGSVGRIHEVDVSGTDILLDWLAAGGRAGVTYAQGTMLGYAIADVVNGKTASIVAPNPFPLADGSTGPTAGATRNGSAAFPVGTMARFSATTTAARLVEPVTIERTTLREQINSLIEHAGVYIDAALNTPQIRPVWVTIDREVGLRAWADTFDSPFIPDDWLNLTVSNTLAGTYAASSIEYEKDWSRVIDRVWVDAAAGSAYVGTGGFPRHEAILSSPDSNTADEVTTAGSNFLGANAEEESGTIMLEDFQPPNNDLRAGAFITITDNNLGLAAAIHRISQIERTFNQDGTENWTISYGRLPGSAIRRIRTLTSRGSVLAGL